MSPQSINFRALIPFLNNFLTFLRCALEVLMDMGKCTYVCLKGYCIMNSKEKLLKVLSTPIPVWECGGFLTSSSNAPTPAWCRTTQLNSDTLYLKTASDSTGWGLRPTRLAPTSDAIHLLSPRPLTYAQWIRGSSDPLLGFNLVDWLTELTEPFYLIAVCQLPKSAWVPHPGRSLNCVLLGFYGGFVVYNGWFSHWSVLIGLNVQPLSPFLRLGWGMGGGTESSNPLITWLGTLTTSPHQRSPF